MSLIVPGLMICVTSRCTIRPGTTSPTWSQIAARFPALISFAMYPSAA